MASKDEGTKGNRQAWVGRLGNFSVQYNLGVASIAVKFAGSFQDIVLDDSSHNYTAEYPQPTWSKYTVLGMVFLGAVVGMLLMGNLGDRLGRRKAMLATLSLVIFGSLGCAILPWGGNNAIYGVIAACRFFLGVGVGGIYPLSAAHSSEHIDEGKDKEAARAEKAAKVGWAFFWQTPGMIAPYVVALLFLGIHSAVGNGFSVSAQWRMLYAVGAIPAAVVFWLNYTTPESQEFLKSQETKTESAWDWARNHPKWNELRFSLFGCSTCWFLYDIAYYGTAIFSPTIIKSIMGETTLIQLCWQTLIVNAAGIPACMLGVTVLKAKGSFFLQLFGFCFMTFTFTLLGVVWAASPKDADGHPSWRNEIFVLYILVNFSLQCAPSISTFVLPAMIFPTECKTTFHGVAAASAKMGAVAGTFMYKPIEDATSIPVVMIVQAVLSLLGAFVTFTCIPRTHHVIGEDEVSPLMDRENNPAKMKH